MKNQITEFVIVKQMNFIEHIINKFVTILKGKNMKWTVIKDFLLRNLTWIGIGLIGLILLCPAVEQLDTILTCVVLEMLALGLSGLALYVYTKIQFTKDLTYGEDGKLTAYEQRALSQVISAIFVGVHLLVGLVYFGTYFVKFG